MLQLFLFRHAKASNSDISNSDFERTLHNKGLLQLNELVQHFDQKKISGKLYISTSKRTRQTYDGIKSIFRAEPIFLDELYLASKEQLDALIKQEREIDTIVLIGHNDGISDLAYYYTGEYTQLSTGAYVCLHFDLSDWKYTSKQTATIASSFYPKDY